VYKTAVINSWVEAFLGTAPEINEAKEIIRKKKERGKKKEGEFGEGGQIRGGDSDQVSPKRGG